MTEGLSFANDVEVEEWVNPGAPPAFTDMDAGLAHLDATEQQAIAELEAEARVRMETASADPRTQSYFMRMDKRTVVRSESEYVQCQMKGVPMRVIPYGHALQLLKDQDARNQQRAKSKQKRKVARRARRRNR